MSFVQPLVMRHNGVRLDDVPDWSCCGSSPARPLDHVLSAALSARNLAKVESMGKGTVVTPCPSCLTNLKTAQHRMEKADFKDKVNALLDIAQANLGDAAGTYVAQDTAAAGTYTSV